MNTLYNRTLDLAFHVQELEKDRRELRAALRGVLPYAQSRLEDMDQAGHDRYYRKADHAVKRGCAAANISQSKI